MSLGIGKIIQIKLLIYDIGKNSGRHQIMYIHSDVKEVRCKLI